MKDSLPVEMQYFNGGSTQFVIPQTGRFWNANIEYVKASKEILPGLKLITTSSAYLGYFSCYPGKSFVPGQFLDGRLSGRAGGRGVGMEGWACCTFYLSTDSKQLHSLNNSKMT